MFTNVHNLDPLPLNQNPNSEFVQLKHFANLVALSFYYLPNLSNTLKNNVSNDKSKQHSSRILPLALKADLYDTVEIGGGSRSRVIMICLGKKMSYPSKILKYLDFAIGKKLLNL